MLVSAIAFRPPAAFGLLSTSLYFLTLATSRLSFGEVLQQYNLTPINPKVSAANDPKAMRQQAVLK